MALTYKRSDAKKARAYERSPGMEPNPGVSHLTVVNPSKRRRRRVSENPLQWIEGRGQRHRHVSPEYETLRQALGWKKRHPKSEARLYPVDEKGTILSRPVSKKLLSNRTRRTGMAYNIGALRRAMRSNPRGRSGGVSETKSSGGVKVSSNGRRRKPRKNTKRRRTRSRVTANRRRRRSVAANRRRRASRRTSRRRGSKRRRTRRNSRRRKSVAANRRRSRRTSRRGSKRSQAAKKGWRTRRRRASMKPNRRRSSRRRASRRNSRRRASRRTSRPGLYRNRKKRKTRRGSKRRATTGYYFGRQKVRRTGKEYIDKYLSRGYMPAVARVRRSSKSRSGRPSILSYPIGKGRGRLSKRRTTRRGSARRSYAIGASHRGRRARRMTANRRRSRRSSKRRRSRRTSRPGLYRNRRRSRRSSRRGSRRRSSRRRLSRNMLAASKVKYGGRGKYRMGRARGRLYQVVEYGPRSKGRPNKKGRRRRLTGYPVLIPASVSERAYVRKYRFGGAAKDAHTTAKRRGYKERKKYARRRGVTKNRRRTSMRRNSRRRSTRRNPRWVVQNRRRRRRRLRRNQFFGADLMKDVLTPVLGGTAGFVAARFLSNGLANVEGIRNILDKDKPAADAENTKIAANVLGIVATLGLATRVKMVKDNQGALVTGMGLALVDRLLGKVQGDAAGYLSGFGEYVSQPLGEYVSQPLGAYVESPGFGEYVSQPLSGLGDTLYAAAGLGQGTMAAAAGYSEGVDPANQAGVDGMMDTMEAAAGMGTMYATAGLGTLYATAGLGAEADSSLKRMYQKERIPFASIHTPTGVAREVTKTLPFDRQVPTSLVTPEGKGYAGGMFARHLFAGMF